MIKRYLFKDPIVKDGVRTRNLKVESGRSILCIFRLISGTVDCEDQYLEKKYRFRENFINLPFKKNPRNTLDTIRKNFPEEVTIYDLDNYFSKSGHNAKFYDSILAELIKCLIAHKEKRSLEAFLYLYRILEGVSYSLPLIFVSKSKDFNKTFGTLKSFFVDRKDGELAFLKNFLNIIFKDEDFYKTSITVSLLSVDVEDVVSDYYQLYLSRMNNKLVTNKVENESIDIKFVGYFEFMLEIRNRFFHNAKGTFNDNFESNQIIYPDLFFEPLIGPGINWVSILLFEVIKHDFANIVTR